MNNETEFQWTTELAEKFAREYRASSSRVSVEQFMEDESKEEVKPTVRNKLELNEYYRFWISNDQTIEISKERLAEILIAESKDELFVVKDKVEGGMVIRNSSRTVVIKEGCNPNKKYTEKEYLEAEEKSFIAAKEICGLPLLDEGGNAHEIARFERYKTFSDYKNNSERKLTKDETGFLAGVSLRQVDRKSFFGKKK